MIRWHIVTSTEYREGTKVAGDIYFIKDTHEIYRGEDNFTESIHLCETLPTNNIAFNRLYINSKTLEGSMHDGTKWNTVIKAVEDTVDPESGNLVTAKAIAEYVTSELTKYMTLVTGAVEGNLATFDANGQVIDSGKKFEDLDGKVGELPEGTNATTIVEYVDESVSETKKYADDTFVRKDSIVASGAQAETLDDASDEKVVSEKLLVEMFTWKEEM